MLCRYLSSWTDALPSCCSGGCLATGVASVSALRQRLCCGERDGPPSADALPLLWSSSLADALPPCYNSGRCFVAVVSSLADAFAADCRIGALGGCFASKVDWPFLGQMLCRLCCFKLAAFAVSPHYLQPLCCLHVLGSVGRVLVEEGPPSCFLAVCLCL